MWPHPRLEEDLIALLPKPEISAQAAVVFWRKGIGLLTRLGFEKARLGLQRYIGL